MNGYSQEQKREIINILLESVYYLDMGLAERNRLLSLLAASFYTYAGAAQKGKSAA